MILDWLWLVMCFPLGWMVIEIIVAGLINKRCTWVFNVTVGLSSSLGYYTIFMQ